MNWQKLSNQPEPPLSRVLRPLQDAVTEFAYWVGGSFYWLLALVIVVGVVGSSLFGLAIGDSAGSAYDFVIKLRWSSPAASDRVIILDIDEKSLAQLAPTLGRYPWRREVFAQVLSELEFGGAASIIFNIVTSDPDRDHSESDEILNQIAADSKVSVFPVIRLPAENDDKSDLHVSQIPGAQLTTRTDPTVAMIIPFLTGMQQHLAINNNTLEDDGILRRYSLMHSEPLWTFPNMVGRAIALSSETTQVSQEDGFHINWRNKKGGYTRVSFGDFLLSLESPEHKPFIPVDTFRGKHVIVGVSAPGLANPITTSMSLLTDGSEILATALDDTLHGTNLKPLPVWIVIILSVSFILFLAYVFTHGKVTERFDSLFLAIEFGSVGVMFLGASYSNAYIDTAPMAAFGLAYYSVAKAYQKVHQRILRGAPERIDPLALCDIRSLVVKVIRSASGNPIKSLRDFKNFEKHLGKGRVFICEDIFDDGHILGSLSDVGFIVVISDEPNETQLRSKIENVVNDPASSMNDWNIIGIPPLVKNDPVRLKAFICESIVKFLWESAEPHA